MSKRGRPKSGKAGNKKVKPDVDYSMWEDIGNQIKIDSAKAVRVTKSGHPTSSASISDILAVLFFHE
jgi:transketolase N-terminal domain/subunit